MAADTLVTGATGTVGRHIIREFVNHGCEVRAGIHTPDKINYLGLNGIETVLLDFGDNATIDKALEGITRIVLITPIAREQVEFERRIIDRACQVGGISHIVKISMIGAGDSPGIKFTRWHREAERYIEASGIPWTFFRNNAYIQNFTRYVQPAGNFIYMPLNGATVSYLDVRDIARVAFEVIRAGQDHYGQTYDLTGPQSLTIDDIADILTRTIKMHIGFIDIPEDTARHALLSTGTPSWLADGMLETFAVQRSGRCSGVSKIAEEITGTRGTDFEHFAYEFSNIFKAIVQHAPFAGVP